MKSVLARRSPVHLFAGNERAHDPKSAIEHDKIRDVALGNDTESRQTECPRRGGGAHVFRASRLSSGNRLFPTQVQITPTAIVHHTPRWVGRTEHSIHVAHVASVRVDTGMLFSDVYIETSGGASPVKCHEPASTLCFVCGPSSLVSESAATLRELGVPDALIRSDRWDRATG